MVIVLGGLLLSAAVVLGGDCPGLRLPVWQWRS